jgi:uncharacterized membrane protein
MAGQKARAASGRAKSGASTRNGSGSNGSGGSSGSGRGGGRTTQATPVRGGKNARGGTGQSGSGQNGGRGQGNRGQGNRGPGGRGPGGRPGPGRPAGPPRRAATDLAEPSVAGDGADERFRVPAWLQWTSLALSLAGLGVSIYLTIAHYTTTSILACSAKGFIDCAKVTTSSQSMVFGVFPVAVLGLAFYLFMVAVNSPWGWRLRIPLVWWARIGSAVVGIGFVLYLVYAEIIQIGNICLWCTSVHVITFLLFALLVFAASIGTATATTTKPAR